MTFPNSNKPNPPIGVSGPSNSDDGDLPPRWNLNLDSQFHNLAILYQALDTVEAQDGDRKGKRKISHDDSSDSDMSGDYDYNGGVARRRIHEPPVEIDFLSNGFRDELENVNQNLSDDEDDLVITNRRNDEEIRRLERFRLENNRYYVQRNREIAKQRASRYASSVHAPDEGSSHSPELELEIDDSQPTLFSNALKAIKDREKNSKQKGFEFTWLPKRNGQAIGVVPSLQELSLKVLADNADAIVSLDGVPDELRHRLSQLLCDSRKINSHFFELLLSGSPAEIRVNDCSWLTEDQFIKSFQTCNTARLEVLQLDQCGRCIPDYALAATLAQSPTWLSRLTSLSLSGACRLSDKGLHVLVSSAPALRSINLSQCSLLTSASVDILADSLGSLLKELYLDDCLIIDAAQIVPALKKLEHLEVLSLAGIQTVSDEFVKGYISERGHNMKELVLKDCVNLTDVSMKIIAEHCPGLCALDLMNLSKLTDLSIRYLTNSCQALHTLKLCRNSFSDEAIAAFLETTGESMKELSLNNIRKVGLHTTSSLVSRAKNLHTLDLSWCRNLSDNELGLIVDSCFSLQLLKVFGCTQVTDVFLNGHSNPKLQIVGLKMSPFLQHVKVHDPRQGALRYSSASVNLV